MIPQSSLRPMNYFLNMQGIQRLVHCPQCLTTQADRTIHNVDHCYFHICVMITADTYRDKISTEIITD